MIFAILIVLFIIILAYYTFIILAALLVSLFVIKSLNTGDFERVSGAADTKNGILKNIKTYEDYESIPKRLEYSHNIKNLPNIHIGQLKLLLSEIELLTKHLKSHDSKCIVAYAGSAPGVHIPILLDMFPKIKLICIDPFTHVFTQNDSKDIVYFLKGNEKPKKSNVVIPKLNRIKMYNTEQNKVFKVDLEKDPEKVNELNAIFNGCVNSNEYVKITDFIQNSDYRCFIIEDYFTNQLANVFSRLSKENNFVFISDIRIKTGEKHVMDIDILLNSAMQYNWVMKMNPTLSMLKFRCPFYNKDDIEQFNKNIDSDIYHKEFSLAKENGIDFVEDYNNRKFKYIKSDVIYLQSFARVNSAEVRLVASKGKYKNVEYYDTKEFEEKMFYYNMVDRQTFHNDIVVDEKIGLDGCADCALMYHILKKYNEKYKIPINPKHIHNRIKDILNRLGRNLKENESHGHLLK